MLQYVGVASQAVPQPGALIDDAAMATLLLIRHGRSADVIPGSDESLDPPLHDEGVRQAAALARRLEDSAIDAVYSSDLRRAVETARPLAEARGLAVAQLKALREVWLGDWERGEFRRRAHVRDPEWLEFAVSGRWERIPGAETDDELRTRVATALDEIARRHVGGTAAVVVHGGVINGYLAACLGTTPSWFCVIENTSITVVKAAAEGRRMLVVANDCHHLYDPVAGA